MSHSYFTRKLLSIKDKNIHFPQDYLQEVNLNGVTSFVFKENLSYQPTTVGPYLIQSSKNMDLKRLQL